MTFKEKKADLFVGRELDPQELAKLRIDTKLGMKGRFSSHELLFNDRVKTVRVREQQHSSIYSLWFEEGGTAEIDISHEGELLMIDSCGCDFWIGWDRIEFYSHKPGDNERMAWGDPDYEGPINSSELMFEVLGEPPLNQEPPTDDSNGDSGGGTVH